MGKHTLEPWGYEYSEANNAYEIAPYTKDGALDWSREVCITADNNEFNAKLIAASPRLLFALELAMPVLDFVREKYPRCQHDDSIDVVEFCRKAIAEAYGEEV